MGPRSCAEWLRLVPHTNSSGNRSRRASLRSAARQFPADHCAQPIHMCSNRTVACRPLDPQFRGRPRRTTSALMAAGVDRVRGDPAMTLRPLREMSMCRVPAVGPHVPIRERSPLPREMDAPLLPQLQCDSGRSSLWVQRLWYRRGRWDADGQWHNLRSCDRSGMSDVPTRPYTAPQQRRWERRWFESS